jgi:nucleoside-diphosphate-sugar epimerase
VEQLLKLDPAPQVSVFDIQTKVNRIEGVEYYDVDITDKQQIFSALEKARPEVIFHTASPPAALSDLPLYMRVNVDGTRNLVECAKVSRRTVSLLEVLLYLCLREYLSSIPFDTSNKAHSKLL